MPPTAEPSGTYRAEIVWKVAGTTVHIIHHRDEWIVSSGLANEMDALASAGINGFLSGAPTAFAHRDEAVRAVGAVLDVEPRSRFSEVRYWIDERTFVLRGEGEWTVSILVERPGQAVAWPEPFATADGRTRWPTRREAAEAWRTERAA